MLAHVKDEEYVNYYIREFETHDFGILDNGCFELGASIDSGILMNIAEKMRPSHLILPDVLHDKDKTLAGSKAFLSAYKQKLHTLGITPIGVLQGNTFDELDQCLDEFRKLHISYIAIPFDCIKDSDWHNIRFLYFRHLLSRGHYIDCQFHFLGIQNPSELLLYNKELKERITSIDTSSPIVNGWVGNRYSDYGLKADKPKLKLAESLDERLSNEQIELINFNILKFKEYARK
jgi:hypothetical protein